MKAGLRLALGFLRVCLRRASVSPALSRAEPCFPPSRASWEDEQPWSHVPGIQDPGVLLARSVTRFPGGCGAGWVSHGRTCPVVPALVFPSAAARPGGGKPGCEGLRSHPWRNHVRASRLRAGIYLIDLRSADAGGRAPVAAGLWHGSRRALADPTGAEAAACPSPLGGDRSCSATDFSLCPLLKAGFSPANVVPGSQGVSVLHKTGREARGAGLSCPGRGARSLAGDGTRGFPSWDLPWRRVK